MKPTAAVFTIAILYIAVGAGGFVTHFRRHWELEDLLIEVTELAAVICGVFLMRRKNWARWLALAWMAFHVAISFPVISQVAIHLVFLIAIAWALFGSHARGYFG